MKKGGGSSLAFILSPLGLDALIGFNRLSGSFLNAHLLFFFISLFNFPQCFDCKSDLGGTKAGAEVRIRNKQLYCNLCYMQFKSELLISLTSVVPCYFWLLFFFFFHGKSCPLSALSAGQPTAMWRDCTPANRGGNLWWRQPMNTDTRGQLQIAGTLGLDILSFTV